MKLPWSKGLYQAEGDLYVFTSRLPLTRYRDIPRFLRWTRRIQKQLAQEPGCAGYTLDAQLFSKTFQTLSAWQDEDAMNRFVTGGAHVEMLKDMKGRLGKPTFVGSAGTRADLPLAWGPANERLDAAA